MLSTLFNLFLANITILLCCFFLFRVVLNKFLTIPVVIENGKLKLALAIPIGAPITVANKALAILLPLAEKKIMVLSKYSKAAIYLLGL